MPSTRTEPGHLLDVNVLVALTIGGHMHHEDAVRWFDRHAATTTWATTPMTEAGLVRLLLNERVYGARLSPLDAVDTLAQLRTRPGWTFLADDATLAAPVVDLRAMIGHRQVNDFHLLNLAIAHDYALVTLDRAIPTYLSARDSERVVVIPLT